MQFKLCEPVQKGFKFSCQKCGNCCKGREEGNIFIYKPDLDVLFKYFKCNTDAKKFKFSQEYFDITSQKFIYTDKKVNKKKSYFYDTLVFKLVGEKEECCFLEEDNSCKIYSVRPFQCTSYPIWRVLLTKKKNWDKNLKKCKGINHNNGSFYSKKRIIDILEKEFELEKDYFLEMRKKKFKIKDVYPFLKDVKLDKG